uniref:Uncharacterized protein n=1 Tax=Anguilla anguilla TaxID=7936 RepID=A0A0E9SM93_ANGAN
MKPICIIKMNKSTNTFQNSMHTIHTAKKTY